MVLALLDLWLDQQQLLMPVMAHKAQAAQTNTSNNPRDSKKVPPRHIFYSILCTCSFFGLHYLVAALVYSKLMGKVAFKVPSTISGSKACATLAVMMAVLIHGGLFPCSKYKCSNTVADFDLIFNSVTAHCIFSRARHFHLSFYTYLKVCLLIDLSNSS